MNPFLMRLLSTTALRDAEGKGGGGGEADTSGGEDPAAGGEEAPEDPPPAGNEAPKEPPIVNNEGQTNQKPADLPDDYWDPRKGEVKLDSLVKAFKDTKSLVGKKTDDLRAEIEQELRAELSPENVPENIEEYAVPDEIAQMVSADDPLLKAFHEAAHKAKIPHATFAGILKDVVAAAPVPDPAAEKAKLGDNADRRIEVVSKFVDRHVKNENVRAVADQIATTAEGVQLLESLILGRAASDRVGSGDNATTGRSAPSWASIKEMMNDDRYMGPTMDPAYVARVDAAKEAYFKAKGQTRAAKSF